MPIALVGSTSLVRGIMLGAFVILGGCAAVDINQSVEQTNTAADAFTAGQLQLRTSTEQREAAQALAAEILQAELNQGAAVKLALVNSPAMQAIIASHWAEAAAIADSGRISNPVFAFERIELGGELEITRSLSFGLIDVLTYPQRYAKAKRALAAAHYGLTASVIDEVTAVRQAWVEAVGAAQQLDYARQVYQSAEAGAELAQRMRAAGNFSELARAREQIFYADAATFVALATHTATARREALIRRLGLDGKQARALELPGRLPDMPQQPLQPAVVSNAAIQQRLDVQMAQAAFEAAADAQGLTLVTSFTDIEVGAIRETAFGDEGRESAWGYEFSISLPLFDWGGMKRDEMNARTLAAANNLEVTLRSVDSILREQYSSYRTAYDVAEHYRTEVVPLRQLILDESTLRYNGMIIGVFELLADFREQVGTVVDAISAYQTFWLADAALQSTLAGRSGALSPAGPVDMQSSGGSDEAH